MRDYNYRKKWQKLLTPEIVKKLTLINEYKGEQRLFIEAHKDELNELMEIAKVQSTEASNKIEGISTADDRLKNLVQAKTTPRNRDESEIAGYRDVLNTIHENYDYIPINANYLLQLHRDLYKFLGSVEGGVFKNSDNVIREMDKDGNEKIRFRPVPAWATPDSIDALCLAFREAKLMFIHDLDDSDNTKAKESAMLGLPYKSIFSEEVKIGERTIEGSQLKWSVFHDFPADRMYSVMQEWVFPFIKTLHSDKNSAYSKYMDDAIFKLPTPLILSKVVDSLDEIYAMMNEIQTADVRGDVYEYLLSKIAQSGRNGQFRTPRHIIRMMVEMMDPASDEVICDPACGTSGFLVASGEYLKEKKKEEIFFDKKKKDHYMNHMFYGYDMDRTMLRIGAMNMMTHGIDNPYIEYRDSLSDQNQDKEKYSLVLANPPFKGSLDAESVSGDLLKVCKTKKTELLFLTLFLRILKVGGRCACIVPDGVLFGSSKAHKDIRKEIVENQRLEAVISMPSGVFKPYAGVSTAILIFTKTEHGGTDNVWFYDMTADGFSLDDKRTPIADNDIPDIIERFRNLDKEIERKRTEKSFMVPKKDIVDNDYDLSINKYKEIEYVPVEYPSTSEIMANIRKIEMEISENMNELEKLLNI